MACQSTNNFGSTMNRVINHVHQWEVKGKSIYSGRIENNSIPSPCSVTVIGLRSCNLWYDCLPELGKMASWYPSHSKGLKIYQMVHMYIEVYAHICMQTPKCEYMQSIRCWMACWLGGWGHGSKNNFPISLDSPMQREHDYPAYNHRIAESQSRAYGRSRYAEHNSAIAQPVHNRSWHIFQNHHQYLDVQLGF